MLGLLYVVFDVVIERQNRPKPSIAQNTVPVFKNWCEAQSAPGIMSRRSD